jgi:hypothetical protein
MHVVFMSLISYFVLLCVHVMLFFILSMCRVFFIFSLFLYDTLLLAGVRCTTADAGCLFYLHKIHVMYQQGLFLHL